MSKIEKTVFISYRRTNAFHARAIFQDLRQHGYDVFLDYDNIDSGAFDRIILNQVRARAHFLVILTPSALERCAEPSDWLRREIETALDHKRNIVPLMFEGFDFKDVSPYLKGKLASLSSYNALRIPSDFFDEAMTRLRTRYLNIPLDVVLHPTPQIEQTTVDRKIAEAAAQPTVSEHQLSASEYFERGYQHGKLGQYDAAIADYDAALRLNPNYAIAYTNRGFAYKNKGDYDRAIADYDAALRLNPDDAIAYTNRGFAYKNKGNIDRAIADFDRALAIEPSNQIALRNREKAIREKRGK